MATPRGSSGDVLDETPVRDERPYDHNEPLICLEVDEVPGMEMPPQIQRLPWPVASTSNDNKKKKRRFRSPVWFLELHGSCFRCMCFVPANLLHEHRKHIPGAVVYEGYPLLRTNHLQVYVALLHKFILALIEHFGVDNRKGLLDLIIERKLTEAEPLKPDWTLPQWHGLQQYYDKYGGEVRPMFMNMQPPNSVLVVANPRIAEKLISGKLRKHLHSVLRL